jgi:phosphopantothenoylcysteine decarboxylase/phosphopantothenate--cysteine ligase
MRDAVLAALPGTDILVMCAAVADYRPARAARAKSHAAALSLKLRRTPDILSQVAARRHSAVVIGFSLDDSLARARAKLRAKRLDLVVANSLSTPGSDSIQPSLVFAGGRARKLSGMTKSRFARELVRVAARIARRPSRSQTGLEARLGRRRHHA